MLRTMPHCPRRTLMAACLLVLLTLALSTLTRAQSPEVPRVPMRQPVIQRVISLPPQDVRRVTLSNLAAGSVIHVRFDSLTPTRPAQVELLLREQNGSGTAYRSLRLVGPTERGQLRFPVPEAGTYLITVRQPANAKRPINLGLEITLELPSPAATPAPRTLPTGTRIAVAVFSFGFLWTTLLLCGAPIIRAFRRRRTPQPQIWYG